MKFNFTIGEIDPFHHITEAREPQDLETQFRSLYAGNYFTVETEWQYALHRSGWRDAMLESAKANNQLVITGEFLENRYFACLHKSGQSITRISRHGETHALMSCLIEYTEQNTIKMLPEEEPDFETFPVWLEKVKALWSKTFEMPSAQYLGDWEADFEDDYKAELSPQKAFDLFLEVKTP